MATNLSMPNPSNFGQMQISPSQPMPAVMPPAGNYGQMQAPAPTGQPVLTATPGGLLGDINANRYAPSSGTGGAVSGTTAGGGYGGSAINRVNNANAGAHQSNFGPVDTGMDAFNHFSNSAYNQGLTRLQPQIDQSNRALQSQLVARGLEPGTAAYQAAMTQQGQTNNDMLNSLNASAQQQGLAAQGQHFGQEMQNNQFGLAQNNQNYTHGLNYDNMANQRTIAGIGAQASMAGANASLASARLSQDGQNYRADLAHQLGTNSLNEQGRQFDATDIYRTQGQDQNYMLGLLGAQNQAQNTGINQFLANQGAQNNWFGQGQTMLNNAPQAQFNPTTGLAQGSMAAGNNMAGAAANQNAAMGELLGNGLAMIPGLSDVRAKENIKKVDNIDGVDVFEYDYKGGEGRFRGVLAHLVAKTHPHAVKVIGGIKHVIYDLLPVNMERIA